MELYRSSTLRSSLRSRPSLRNRKREQLETEGALEEEKLLSSGTELEASLNLSVERPKSAHDYMEVLPPRPHELPKEKKDGGTLAQRFKALRNGGFRFDSRTGSLGGYGKMRKPVKRGRNQTLSFRSELANRIKHTTLARNQSHAQSMFDLRCDDGFEVEMFYENLLDAGEGSDGDSVHMMALDDLSIRSDSSLAVGGGLDVFGTQWEGAGKMVQSLDLAGIDEEDVAKSSSSSSTADVGPALDSRARSASDVQPNTTTATPLSVQTHAPTPSQTPPPSPRIALIRANTMRKTSTSNAVMVLSGGDGYVDLNAPNLTSRNEDACLLLWIYKF